MVLEEPEPAFHLRLGEPRSEVTQDVVGVVPAATEPTELSLEYLGLEQRGVPASRRGETWVRDRSRRRPNR